MVEGSQREIGRGNGVEKMKEGCNEGWRMIERMGRERVTRREIR